MARLGKNKVEIRGNLGLKPELRQTKTGVPVTNLRVAVNEKRGQNIVTSWFDVVCFGKLAEICASRLDKGALVDVEGRLRAEQYQNKTGDTLYREKIEAHNVDFLSPRPQQGAQQPAQESEQVPESAASDDGPQSSPDGPIC
jgi:single-strand DNA-binding protein